MRRTARRILALLAPPSTPPVRARNPISYVIAPAPQGVTVVCTANDCDWVATVHTGYPSNEVIVAMNRADHLVVAHHYVEHLA